jgi:hypothetical protein
MELGFVAAFSISTADRKLGRSPSRFPTFPPHLSVSPLLYIPFTSPISLLAFTLKRLLLYYCVASHGKPDVRLLVRDSGSLVLEPGT